MPFPNVKTSGSLSASRYRVSFIAKELLDLPSYLGSTLRGAFGHAFRVVACPAIHDECPIPSQCPYHLIFETAPPPGAKALRTHEEIPRPFVIAPATTTAPTTRQPGRQQFNPGDEVAFELVLIGRAQEFFPYFVVALREVDRIGRGRRTVELHRIEALPPVPPGSVINPRRNDSPPDHTELDPNPSLDLVTPNVIPPPH
jgi:hypothetical protein